MRLKYQLFLLLLLTGGLLIALMAAIGSWNFNRGFIGYINDIERQQLNPIVDALAAGYALEGSWDWVTDDRREWTALLATHLDLRRPPRPGGLRREGAKRRNEPGANPRPPPPGGSDFAPPPRPRGSVNAALTLDPRLLLADADRTVIIGRERGDRQVHWQPVTTENRIVGYLGNRERQTLPGRLDQAFAEKQRRGFLYAALAMVLLSALLAVALAGRLARPLLAVNDAVARIGRGEYAHRVPVARSDEIGDLSRSINTLAVTLEKNLGARRQWLAEISHELRTPVAILQGELEAIQDGVNSLDEVAIDSLHAETLRLARLIDDLHDLTLSDVGALDYRFERLDLGEVVTARIATVRNQSEAAALDIHVSPASLPSASHQKFEPEPLIVDGDGQRLCQLVDNLLQNSVRYTDADGEVCVTLSRTQDRAVIVWTDSAPGVTDEQLGRLFEPLYRADASRNRGNGGAGLGLAIVLRIIEAHGGTIAASHSPKGGLALRIELPLSQENAS